MSEALTGQRPYEATQYSPAGLLGVLTPQANTTVETELSILLPPGFGMATARLVSSGSSMSERLIDYVEQQNSALGQFANIPLSAAIFACTGAAYLVEPAEERRKREAIEGRHGYPFVTAADAVSDAVTALGVQRVGVVSPYGEALHRRSLVYWEKRGLVPHVVSRIEGRTSAFHPIYSIHANSVCDAYGRMLNEDVDCVLILGTGLPTLPVIAARTAPVPVLSTNLCLMWRACVALNRDELTASGLQAWLGPKAHWLPRFRLCTSQSDA